MSYARFGWGGSDVYVFGDVDGHLTCCACFLQIAEDGPSDWRTPTAGPKYVKGEPLRRLPSWTYGEMIAHLSEHVDAKHHVPEIAFSRLDREMREAIEYEMEQ